MNKKIDPNYGKALIYKIVCFDVSMNVKDCYVGSTTNFYSRRKNHQSVCNNPKSSKYNLKVYETIRANGGWSNFRMILVEYYACSNKEELLKREREIFDELNPTMNGNFPSRSRKEYLKYYNEKNPDYRKNQKVTKSQCELCGGRYTSANKTNHYNTIQHLSAELDAI